MICGIDEAGRGPAIGPLVICGVLASDEQIKRLADIGVKDSKLLSITKREALFDIIKKAVAAYKIIIIPPEEIDARESHGLNLNQLEAAKTIEIINELKPNKAIVDCPSTNTAAYKDYIYSHLHDQKIELIAEHKADVNYPVVSAASILAKVTRDREIDSIKQKIGVDFGSGYPSDPRTKKFIEEHHEDFPEVLRHSWDTVKQAKLRPNQKSLFDFVKKPKEELFAPTQLSRNQLFKAIRTSITFIDTTPGHIEYFKNLGFKVADIKKPGVRAILVGDFTLTFYKNGKLLVQGQPDKIKSFMELFVS